jgi:cysteine desulfurase / selenocysteine lyase
MPAPVTDAVNTYLTERAMGDFPDFKHIEQRTGEVKNSIARLLHTTSDRIAFVDNTSDGLNILANGLQWKTGDRILVNRMEFPANIYPFMNLRNKGVELDIAESRDNTLPPDLLFGKVTPRTRLVSISHVQYLNGYLADIEEIGSFCRDRGILLSVDAIQSTGAVPIHVEEMKIDFLASSSYKWLLSPEGTGFIYISRELQDRIQQAYVGWTSVTDYFNQMRDFNLNLDPTARRYENGTLNVPGILGLGASLELLNGIGIENIRHHILDLTDPLIKELQSAGITCCTPADRSQRGGIVSFKVPDSELLLKTFSDLNIRAAIRGGNVRISPHFYNTVSEIESLIECVLDNVPVRR